MLKSKRPEFDKPLLVMIIDDSDIFRKQIVQTVKHLNIPFKVFEASNVAVAKKALEQYVFDIILCDLNMPGENGIDFVAHAKGVKKISTPIVMITSESGIATILEAIEKGASDYLIKPWKEEDFETKFFACFGAHVREEVSKDRADRNRASIDVQKEEITRTDIRAQLKSTTDTKIAKVEPKPKVELIIPNNTQILLLEDSEQYRSLVKKTLAELNFQGKILEADKVAGAIKILQTQPVHLGIIDWHLPDATGLDLIKKMRQEDRFKKTPLLMLTAESDVGKMLEAVESGVDDYIVKPFVKNVLRDKMNLIWEKYNKKSVGKTPS
jgi:two-component system, chemotaxis family, chemotaxis protein CheY